MSILAQIGVVLLIVCIVLILIRSNKTLEEVSKEGEHFVDEWDLRQQRKEERALEKEEKKQQKEERVREKKLEKSHKGNHQTETKEVQSQDGVMAEHAKGKGIYEPDEREMPDDVMSKDVMEKDIVEEDLIEESIGDMDGTSAGADIFSMDKYRNPQITLVELDENHRTVRRIPVTKLPFTIGRSKENMLELDDLCVARKHCRIVERNGAFLLEDVGTANKLYVNGEITDHVELADQLEVYIGNVELRVEMGVARSEYTQLYGGRKERYYE
ncbi:MAG: FHA domain-containing protein [Clostridiales bacterium]|nr:FHA domain-containing protein [Clostridiales bacterium]